MKFRVNCLFIGIITLSLLSGKTFSQNDVAVTDTLSGSSLSEEKIKTHSLFAGAGYGSNMVYLGSTISQNKPYNYASITYGLKDVIYLSGSAVHLTDMSPFAAFYTFSASFSHAFSSWFDISGGISRYQVQQSLTDTLFNSFTYGEINLGIDWKILYTRLSAGGIFSGETRGYYQIKNSRYFQTPEFTKKKLYFSFDPYANLIFGTITKSETVSGTVINSFPPFRKHGGTGSQSVSTTKYTNLFTLVEVDFGIPVAFNSPRITIEAEPGYIYPLYEDTYYPGTKGFLFLISAYLRIF